MKRIITLFLALVLLGAAVLAWLLLAPATDFSQKSAYLYVYEDSTSAQTQVMHQLNDKQLIKHPGLLNTLAEKWGVWDKLKSGRYEISKGQSVLSVVRMLRNNKQAPVKLVINKLRTREDFARMLGRNFNTDSAKAIGFLSSNDSLSSLGVDTNTVMTLIIPDTYIFNWNTSVKKVLQHLKGAQEEFWKKDDREQKAAALNLTPQQVYSLASIVEEETNYNPEKGNIASVYLNRLNKGMYLGADPTIKFALRDFGLRRIYFGHLAVVSPYNTYKNKGLPPGPICTPAVVTIDAVLNQPKTDYLFFVASAELNGTHHFSTNFAEHDQYAKAYQKVQDERGNKQPAK
ncbi:endolytic transglycosylase MltG [Deminuibacter soli]|uniref:Endolytic murein transglycosylase n=1 Tax=Deminuibacter soli TaxID=2291815 RepID=A0A3E1NJK7_9BACT|nr:endolytic transglycosylase MltG [Deminuibacter soli]RFM28061.1 endolytic transglycosylase MltG [Deminuibacter soli]